MFVDEWGQTPPEDDASSELSDPRAHDAVIAPVPPPIDCGAAGVAPATPPIDAAVVEAEHAPAEPFLDAWADEADEAKGETIARQNQRKRKHYKRGLRAVVLALPEPISARCFQQREVPHVDVDPAELPVPVLHALADGDHVPEAVPPAPGVDDAIVAVDAEADPAIVPVPESAATAIVPQHVQAMGTFLKGAIDTFGSLAVLLHDNQGQGQVDREAEKE